LRALRALPPFSAVAAYVLKLVARDGVEFRKVAETIKTDAPLSADTLRIANSALFGPRFPVTGVLHATVMLGIERVRSVVTTAALKGFVGAARSAPAVVRCWRHNLACALICEEVARKASLDRDFAYTAGLLHDLGRLAMIRTWLPRYAPLLDSAKPDPLALLDMESREFGIRHTRAGFMLIREWKLPAEFAEIADRHHAAQPQEQTDIAALVRFACSLADSVGFGVTHPPADGEPQPECLLHSVFTGVVDSRLGGLGTRLAERINELECCLA
jgi:putative nucleotidyltransferase with HDIG domain